MHDFVREDVAVDAEEATARLALVPPRFGDAVLAPGFLRGAPVGRRRLAVFVVAEAYPVMLLALCVDLCSLEGCQSLGFPI